MAAAFIATANYFFLKLIQGQVRDLLLDPTDIDIIDGEIVPKIIGSLTRYIAWTIILRKMEL